MPEVLTTVELNDDGETCNIHFDNIGVDDVGVLFAELGSEEGQEAFGAQLIAAFREKYEK
jgi:hypothetical protein